jgi:hypothetical protein
MHFQVCNFTRFTFNKHLQGPAAYLAIRRKPLRWRTRVNRQFEALAAVWALNGFAGFHV